MKNIRAFSGLPEQAVAIYKSLTVNYGFSLSRVSRKTTYSFG